MLPSQITKANAKKPLEYLRKFFIKRVVITKYPKIGILFLLIGKTVCVWREGTYFKQCKLADYFASQRMKT